MSDLAETASALRQILDQVAAGELTASGRERAYIAGALAALESINSAESEPS